MASLKSKILIGVMRNRHLLKGKLHKPVQEKSIEAVLKFRQGCEEGAEHFGKLPKGVTVKKEVIHTIISEWLIPDKASYGKLIYYIHGGGYVSGSCNDHRSLVAKIALNSGITNLLFEYGLAPENPFPAALDDTINVYRAVLEKGYKSENIVFMGESAGGGLCLATLLALRDKNIPLPKAAVAISPWTDLSCSSDSYHTKNKVSLAPTDSWTVFSHYYAANNDVMNPYISPLWGNLQGLPPIFINAGNADELFDDSQKFYEKAKAAGADIQFCEGKDVIHCYPMMAPFFPEATEAMNEIIEFIKQQLYS